MDTTPNPTPRQALHLRVAGWVPDDWSERFEGIDVTHAPDGTTVLCGELPDQAALFGILQSLESRGVKLVALFAHALLLLLFIAAPAAGATLTLEEALARALTANPAVARAEANLEAARAQRLVALSAALPHATLEAAATRHDTAAGFELGGMAVTLQPKNDWAARLTVEQPLYLGGRVTAARRQAARAEEAARAAHDATEEQLLFRTAADYLALIEADALVEVERRNLALSSERRANAERFLEAGEATKVDLLRAEAAEKGAARRLAAAEQMRIEALSRLKLDLALDEEIVPTTPDLALPPVPAAHELVLAALAARPELKQAAAAVEMARLEVRRERGAHLPALFLQVSVARQKSKLPTDRPSAIGLALRIPVLDGGATAGRVAAAEQGVRRAEASAAEARRSVREEVSRALAALDTARRTSELAQEQLAAAEGEYGQVAALYRSQEATSLEMDAAAAALAEARRAVVIESLQSKVAELKVWLAAGSLRTALLHHTKES